MTRELGGRSVPHSAREMSIGWRHYRYLASNRSLLGPLGRMEANVSSRPLYESRKSPVAGIDAGVVGNPKKRGRWCRADIAQWLYHWHNFPRAKRPPLDCACGAGTARK